MARHAESTYIVCGPSHRRIRAKKKIAIFVPRDSSQKKIHQIVDAFADVRTYYGLAGMDELYRMGA